VLTWSTLLMIQKMSNYGSCVLHVHELKKKELKSRSVPVFAYTFKDNKIITVSRNEEFISEIIGTTFYDKSILKRQF